MLTTFEFDVEMSQQEIQLRWIESVGALYLVSKYILYHFSGSGLASRANPSLPLDCPWPTT